MEDNLQLITESKKLPEDSYILNELYPLISKKVETNMTKYKACINRFVQNRSEQLYDIAPFSRMFFGQNDIEDFYKSINISEKDIDNVLKNVYYYTIEPFNPKAAKDEFTIAVLCIIRHFYKNKKNRELELSMIYLAFSGKFYPSIHSGSFPVCEPSEHRYVMEFVVNHRLSNRFDLKREGNLFKAILSICKTWINKYNDKFDSFDDEDVVYIIQQLHTRIKSFMINIAREYYTVYDNKTYMTYDSDNLSEDNYRLADNDSLKIERIVERTMNYINNTNVDYKLCKMASDGNVRTDEVKSIIETILNDQDNLIILKEFIRLTVSDYFSENKNGDIHDYKFISYCITPKPNSKNKDILRQKEIVETWLNEKSPSYRKRKSRKATKSSYHKSVITYFVLIIYNSNK